VWLSNIPIVYSTLDEWILANQSSFQDFTQETALVEAVRKKEADWISFGKASKSSLTTSSIIWVKPVLDGGKILVIPMTPNCIGGFDGSTGSTPYLAIGKKCTFAFAGQGNNKLTVLKKFEIDSRVIANTVTCVKGKLTKKVTAVKPKCPSGYKVKK
jgi:hypothetical protein